MNKVIVVLFLIAFLFPASSWSQVHKVRQWPQLMGTRGWPIHQDGSKITILDISGIPRSFDAKKLSPEESQYIEGLQLPDKETFERDLIQGDAAQAVLDRAEETKQKMEEAKKAARAAHDVRSTGTVTANDGAEYDMEIVQSHAKERRAANRLAHKLKISANDDAEYSRILDGYKRSVIARSKKKI